MLLSPVVPLLLTACWILSALAIAVFYYRRRSTEEATTTATEMKTSLKGIRAEILQLEYDAQNKRWREEDWEGPQARVRAQVRDTSHEATVLTPYAEASVSVNMPAAHGNEAEGMQRRHCSLCLN